MFKLVSFYKHNKLNSIIIIIISTIKRLAAGPSPRAKATVDKRLETISAVV